MFSFDLVGANTDANGNTTGAAYIVNPTLSTFNTTTTTTTTATGNNQQAITLTSSEAVNVLANTTTDTFTISTPTNFLTTSTIGSGTATINLIQFDIGDTNSGSAPVMLSLAVSSATATGSFTIGMNSAQTISNPTLNLATDGLSYSGAEGVNTGSATSAIDTSDVDSFTYSVTYATLAPEPSTWAMLSLGLLGSAMILRRRRTA